MRRIRHGFSLVELMIVVAIIGILAAIAIPNLMTMQYKAKRSEVPGNVDGIKTAEIAYDAAFDAYVVAAIAPRAAPTKAAVEWVTSAGWDSIGWRPDGAVRGVYDVALGKCALEAAALYPLATLTFCVTGKSDVDGDGVLADFYGGSLTNATIVPADASVY